VFVRVLSLVVLEWALRDGTLCVCPCAVVGCSGAGTTS